ncbi:alpha/beta fold hydrolase [Oceanicella sp. SM1341]|uniref:alpha/beta fold hydrolase n=1 Tax=Oceanicella sp. SM1341 TaxID=1548889 RepID=UPI000E4A77EF|nr:alpha/beta hydrolase [Oceanicella sp. SM1341]
MTAPQFHSTTHGRRIAYNRTMPEGDGANLPGIVFLGGFRSDMEGTKAIWLEAQARAEGRAFLRFDYSGHGQSSEDFLDGCIGDWAADAAEVIAAQSEGPQILVGSSMGGWISLLLARERPELVAGLVGIAAAPDFTEDSMWEGFSDKQRAEMEATGRVALPSDYSEEPYIITARLIEDGRRNLVLRSPLKLPFPVRLLHGTEDTDVALSVPMRLISHAEAADMRLTVMKGADHRFSAATDLHLIWGAVSEVTESLG